MLERDKKPSKDNRQAVTLITSLFFKVKLNFKIELLNYLNQNSNVFHFDSILFDFVRFCSIRFNSIRFDSIVLFIVSFEILRCLLCWSLLLLFFFVDRLIHKYVRVVSFVRLRRLQSRLRPRWRPSRRWRSVWKMVILWIIQNFLRRQRQSRRLKKK